MRPCWNCEWFSRNRSTCRCFVVLIEVLGTSLSRTKVDVNAKLGNDFATAGALHDLEQLIIGTNRYLGDRWNESEKQNHFLLCEVYEYTRGIFSVFGIDALNLASPSEVSFVLR